MLTLDNWRERRYQTIDGRQVRVVAIDMLISQNSSSALRPHILGLVLLPSGEEYVMRWDLAGRHINGTMGTTLIDAPEEQWVAIYATCGAPQRSLQVGPVGRTRIEAIKAGAILGHVIETVRLPKWPTATMENQS